MPAITAASDVAIPLTPLAHVSMMVAVVPVLRWRRLCISAEGTLRLVCEPVGDVHHAINSLYAVMIAKDIPLYTITYSQSPDSTTLTFKPAPPVLLVN